MRSIVDVRAQEESLVQRLKLAEGDSGNEAIQRKLDEIFKKSNLGDAVVAAQFGKNSLPKLFVTSTRVTLEEDLKAPSKKATRQTVDGQKFCSNWNLPRPRQPRSGIVITDLIMDF